jgi:H+/gluconate symporter-like permease
MVSNLGVLLALGLLIGLALRGVNIILASVFAAALVAVTNGRSLDQGLMTDFAGGMMGFAGKYYMLFLAGAVLGRVIEESHAATSIARALTRWLGEQRLLWVIVGASAVLTYGGVSVFVIVFTVYPLAFHLAQGAGLPKRLLASAFLLGAATFATTALPGAPSIHNAISATALDTTLTAGWGLGLVASAAMLALGMAYLTVAWRNARQRGERFVPMAGEEALETVPEPSATPSAPRAFAPLAIVLAAILTPQWLLPALDRALIAPVPLSRLTAYATNHTLAWTCAALACGAAGGLIWLRRFLPAPLTTLSRGAERSVLPLFNTAAVIGFGAVVKETPIFGNFAQLMVNTKMPPIVSMAAATNVFAGITGSASGGLAIFFDTLAPLYPDFEAPRAVVHRLVTIASGGLDSLPHSGALITMLTVMHLTHRQAYKDAFVITVLVPLAALALVTALALAIY